MPPSSRLCFALHGFNIREYGSLNLYRYDNFLHHTFILGGFGKFPKATVRFEESSFSLGPRSLQSVLYTVESYREGTGAGLNTVQSSRTGTAFNNAWSYNTGQQKLTFFFGPRTSIGELSSTFCAAFRYVYRSFLSSRVSKIQRTLLVQNSTLRANETGRSLPLKCRGV